jgi:hypothetical protein
MVVMNWWMPQLQDPSYGNRIMPLRSRLGGGQPFVLVLGSSRTGFGVQGMRAEEQLERDLGTRPVVFNFGCPGAGPVLQLIYLKRLLAAGIRPNLLLVEVLPPLLGGPGPSPQEAHWLAATRLTLAELRFVERHDFPKKLYRTDWWLGWPVPWYAHRFDVVSWASPALLPVSLRQEWGRGADDSGWTRLIADDLSPAKRRLRVEFAQREFAAFLGSFSLCEPACRAQRELLELCRQEGIPVALFLMPEGATFRSWYPASIWAQIDAYLQGLSRTFGVPLVNAREWVPEEDFSDSHHLLPSGSAAFTDRLTREALLPLLRAQQTARLR